MVEQHDCGGYACMAKRWDKRGVQVHASLRAYRAVLILAPGIHPQAVRDSAEVASAKPADANHSCKPKGGAGDKRKRNEPELGDTACRTCSLDFKPPKTCHSHAQGTSLESPREPLQIGDDTLESAETIPVGRLP
eukprot:4354190-Pleurochrysis_carterae.AAC.1